MDSVQQMMREIVRDASFTQLMGYAAVPILVVLLAMRMQSSPSSPQAQKLKNAMRDTKNSAADGVRDSKNKMMNSAQSVKSNISNAASSAYTSAAESASDLSDRASNAAQGIQKEAKYAVDQSAARGGGVATTSGTQSGGPVGGRFGGMGNSTHTSTNSTIGSMDGYQEDMVRVSTPVDLNLGKVVQ